MLNLLAAAAFVLSGTLATANPNVLENVQSRRIRNGWGLEEKATEGTILLAVDNCSLLGANGLLITSEGQYSAYVVDCTCAEHRSLSELNLLADVNLKNLNHKRATLIIWKAPK